jgi:septal ring factor EnvC (AmiA/AmiB activator)
MSTGNQSINKPIPPNPGSGCAGVIVGVIVIFFGVAAYFAFSYLADRVWSDKTPANYTQQLQHLDNVQQSLKNLSDFVAQQRTSLEESERVISKLKDEKHRIEPLVQADRKIVEAVFQLQEQRAASSALLNYLFGFASGVISSLVATVIHPHLLRALRVWRRARKPDEPDTAS